MSETEKNSNPQSEGGEIMRCPGHLFTEARETQQLSIQQVATELHLQPKMVEALEQGALEQLPPMTFVNGYLRSYAKLLGLEADPIVESYNLCASDSPTLVATNKTGSEAKSSDLPVQMVTYLVVIGLLVLVVMWWAGNRGGSNEVVETMVPAPAVSETPAPVIDTTAPAESTDDTTPSEPPVETETVAPEQEEATEAPVEEPVAEPKVEETVEPVVLIEPLTDATPQSSLRIVLEKDSWLEIKDAAGRRLAYGLGEEGEERTLWGEAPFAVFLGNAPGVVLYYNDESFDHSRFQRRELARFRLGRSQDNAPRE